MPPRTPARSLTRTGAKAVAEYRFFLWGEVDREPRARRVFEILGLLELFNIDALFAD
jgi:hypothetical protein